MMVSDAFATPMIEIRPSNQRTSTSDFAEDHLELVLKDQEIIRDIQYFYSSYGDAGVDLVQDSQGVWYALLHHGRGRGTHVRSEYITVFKIIEKLNELITFPLNGPAGMTSTWEYTYFLKKPANGGLEFILTLKIVGDDAETYPEDTIRTIVIK